MQDVVGDFDDRLPLRVGASILLLRPDSSRIIDELQFLVLIALRVPVRHGFELTAGLPLLRPAAVLVRVPHVEVRHAFGPCQCRFKNVIKRQLKDVIQCQSIGMLPWLHGFS